jgi:hypothetical protein
VLARPLSKGSFRDLPFVCDRLRTYVETLCRLVCNSLDARAVRVRLTRFNSIHEFNKFASPGPMSSGAEDCSELCEAAGAIGKRPIAERVGTVVDDRQAKGSRPAHGV